MSSLYFTYHMYGSKKDTQSDIYFADNDLNYQKNEHLQSNIIIIFAFNLKMQ